MILISKNLYNENMFPFMQIHIHCELDEIINHIKISMA
jgi:hypothetical protein